MKNKFVLIATIILIFGCNLFSFSQTSTINKYYKIIGIVKGTDKKLLPYIYVSLKEQPLIRTATELDGSFVLTVPDTIKLPYNLKFYAIGFEAKTYTVTQKNLNKKIQITLVKDKKHILADKPKTTTKTSKKKGKVGEDLAATEITSRTSFDKAALHTGTLKATPVAGVEASAALSLPPPNIGGGNNENIEAGQLTAGELNDFTKWVLWKDMTQKILEVHSKEWKMFPDERYFAQLTNPDGMPIVDALVFLKDVQGNTIWQAHTDNTGKAELWAKMLNDSLSNFGEPYSLVFSYQGKSTVIDRAYSFPRINSAELKVKCSQAKQVDIDFIVDATGSMGDEIRYLQAELYDVISKVQNNNPHIVLRMGSLFYRDKDDDYLTVKSPLDTNINNTIEFIKKQSAAGGGDWPEAVDVALTESIENRDWSPDALARIAFLILDAPPHQEKEAIEKVHRQIRLAAMKGIRIVPLVCSGADKSTEFLMRSIALATNGTYVFLTDESGIGAPHLKPTTDKYEVEKLNHILLRVISEFCQLPNCNNNWTNFDKEINSQEKFIPKPYKENPDDNTERLETAQVLQIFPNPCNGELTVEIRASVSELYITDVTGKALQFLNFDNPDFSVTNPKSITMNLQGYSNGIYFVNAFCQGRWYTVKLALTR